MKTWMKYQSLNDNNKMSAQTVKALNSVRKAKQKRNGNSTIKIERMLKSKETLREIWKKKHGYELFRVQRSATRHFVESTRDEIENAKYLQRRK